MARQKTRVQQRKVKPRVAQFQPPPPPQAGNRRLQPRMLEGHSPATVIRVATYLGIFQVGLVLVAALLAVLLPDIPLKALTVLVFVVAIVIPGTLVWPALLLALRDRKAQPELIQGQMVGASPVSMVYGLGMLYMRTRQRETQVNIERRLLRQVPQSQVQLAVRVTPNLRHVSSLQVMGPRMGGNVPADVPEKFRFAERFPLVAIAGAYGAVFGLGIILILVPVPSEYLWLHLLIVPVGMALAALGARFLTQWYQKRLEAQLSPDAG